MTSQPKPRDPAQQPAARRALSLLGVLAAALLTQPGCPTTPGSDTAPPDTHETVDKDDAPHSTEGETTPPDTDVAVCPLGCDDGNPCTDDRCGELGCVYTPNVLGCDDGDPCTQNDRCSAGRCSGLALVCDDRNPCTTDTCVLGACQAAPRPGPCDDEDACTAGDTCIDGRCEGQPRACPAGPCEVASCSPRTGCALAFREGSCNDGNACTRDDACVDGRCQGTLARCDDNNACTDDYCDPNNGCVHRPNARPCDDGDRCNGPDVCVGGSCQPGPGAGCCQSDAECPQPDECHIGKCHGGTCTTAPRCDDADPCTLDECDSGECQFRPWSAVSAPGTTVLDDFEGPLAHWTFTTDNHEVAWSTSTSWSNSGTTSLYLGDPTTMTYDHGPVSASATRPILIPPGESTLSLTVFADLGDDGSCVFDVLELALTSAATSEREVLGRICASGLGLHRFDLALPPGRYDLELRFDTRDDLANDGTGLFVDDLTLELVPACR